MRMGIVLLLLWSFISYCNTKTLCRNNKHVTGEWKERINWQLRPKSFYCCGWDNYDYLSNTTLCGSESSKSDDPYRASKTLLAQSGDNACSCDIKSNSRYSVSKRESYEWTPEHCYFIPWNTNLFCTLLGNRTVYLFGDSTMVQSGATLISMINYDGGHCADQIMIGRSTMLFIPSHGVGDLFSNVAFYKPSICIMNAGAHLHDIGDIYSVWENIKNRVEELKSSSEQTTFVWKTQNPGHVSIQFTEPVKEYIPIDLVDDKYAYHLYPTFDALAYNYSAELGFKVLDMSPLYLRPDAHSDQMHYCLPGPIDLFSILFLNMLHSGEL